MKEPRMQLEDWLDDLCVRFIINLPEEDLSSVARICFQVEEAQWFYEDFIRPLDPSLPSMTLRSFCLRIFQHCPLLSAFSADNHMRAFEEFLLYKTRVPVRGAIMLNEAMDAVVLVKGWKKGANWSFPRGKINKDEDDLDCAVREVYEETGYDIREAGLVPADEEVKYIEITMREQHMRLYVFRDVPVDTHFEPRTRKEISRIEWYRLSDLPAFRKKGQQHAQDGVEAAARANKFYMVAPFLVPLKKWVVEQKKRDTQRALRNQHLAPTYADDILTEEEQTGEKGNEYLPSSNQEAGIDTMEGATAALHRLLKFQPPTQGLQPEAASSVQSPASKRSGEALLALLQGTADNKVEGGIQPAERSQQSQHGITYYNAPILTSPRHAPRLLPSNALPPPPLATQSQDNAYRFQPELRQPLPQSGNLLTSQQHQISETFLLAHEVQSYEQHHAQPQQLQHPQPLPPQVQIAVFTGDHAHGPRVPHPEVQQTVPRHVANLPAFAPLPQFPDVPGSMKTAAAKRMPHKMTSHSLAHLNKLKSRQDRGASNTDNQNELPSNQRAQGYIKMPVQPQELSADEGQTDRAIMPDIYGSNLDTNTGRVHLPAPQPLAPANRPVLSDDHRSSLLSMFKASASKPVVADLAATITTPADIRQGSEASSSRKPSVDPSFSVASKPLTIGHSARREPNLVAHEPPLPLRPVSILPRPSELAVEEAARGDSASMRQESALRAYSNQKPPAVEPVKLQADMKPVAKAAKPFQPQILRRPQPTQPISPAELAAPSPTSFPGISMQVPLSRTESQPEGHKQALLSLFRNGSTTRSSDLSDHNEAGMAQARTFEIAPDVFSRSRVDSLASWGGDMRSEHSSHRGSQAPISAEEKGFLLGYLDSIARGKKG